MPLSEDNNEAPPVTGGLKTVSYAANEAGWVEARESESWQPLNEANRQAWREIETRVQRVRHRVEAGRLSCLAYYLAVNQMSVLVLARSARRSPLAVVLHCLPWFFHRLHPHTLQAYAEIFQVSPETLQQGRLGPAVSQFAPHPSHATPH